jgi:hypothetical protein
MTMKLCDCCKKTAAETDGNKTYAVLQTADSVREWGGSTDLCGECHDKFWKAIDELAATKFDIRLPR